MKESSFLFSKNVIAPMEKNMRAWHCHPFTSSFVNAPFFCDFLKLNWVMNVTRDVCRWLITSANEIINFAFCFFFLRQQQIKDELCEVVQEMESHDSENKHSSKEKQMSIGRKKFNMDPKKGEYPLNDDDPTIFQALERDLSFTPFKERKRVPGSWKS